MVDAGAGAGLLYVWDARVVAAPTPTANYNTPSVKFVGIDGVLARSCVTSWVSSSKTGAMA